MIISLFYLFLLSLCAAHPFDARVVGHQMQVELRAGELCVRYQLELPLTILRTDMVETKSAHPDENDSNALTQLLLEAKHREIREGFKLRLNDVLTPWERSHIAQRELLQEGQFALFRAELYAPLTDSTEQIAIINQLYMEEQSIFNHQLQVGPGVQLVDTDILPLSEQGIRQNFHGAWQSEDWLRELRMSTRLQSSIRSFLEGQWRQWNSWPELTDAPQILMPKSFQKRWIQGQLKLEEGMALLGFVFTAMALTSRYRRSKKRLVGTVGVSWTIVFLGSALPLGVLELGVGLCLGILAFFSRALMGTELACVALIVFGASSGNTLVSVVLVVGTFLLAGFGAPSEAPSRLDIWMKWMAVIGCLGLGMGLFLH